MKGGGRVSSYIDTICGFAQGMRSEGRDADADDAMKQCDRMRAILLPDRELVSAYEMSTGESGDPWVDAICGEMQRRQLHTWCSMAFQLA